MKARMIGYLRSLLRLFGGVTSGVALYLIGDWIMSIRVAIGYPPQWLYGTTLAFAMAYLASARVPSVRWRRWARIATFTGTSLWSMTWFVGWTGHGGSGYFEASRMFGHLYNIADVAEGPSDLAEVAQGIEWFREGTKDYFGEPQFERTVDGWIVSVVSPHTGRVCAVYRGSVGAWPATKEGFPRCRLPPPWGRLAVFLGMLAVGIACGTLPAPERSEDGLAGIWRDGS